MDNDKRINNLEREMMTMKVDVVRLQKDVDSNKNALIEMKDDTKWIRRTMTNTLIGGVATIVIASIIAAFAIGG